LVGVGSAVAVLGALSIWGAVKAHTDVNSESAAKHCSLNPTVCPPGVDPSNINKNATGAKAMDIIGGTFTPVGGAAVVGGLVWHYLEPVDVTPRAAVVMAPWVGRGGGGVVTVTF
jgi:hypothetical protein